MLNYDNNSRLPSLSGAGFTVIEIVMTIVVAAFYIISMSVIVTNLTVLNARSRDLTVATSFAENKFEELRSNSFLALPDDGITVDFEAEMPQTLTEPRSATYTISEISDALKQVDIVMEYEDYGLTRTLRYSTLIGELGVGQ